MRSLVQTGKIDLSFVEAHGIHAAADVHANYIGHNFVLHRHGCADGATFACVYVRHDAYFAARRKFAVAHPAYLFNGGIFDHVGINDGRGKFSLNFHTLPSRLKNKIHPSRLDGWMEEVPRYASTAFARFAFPFSSNARMAKEGARPPVELDGFPCAKPHLRKRRTLQKSLSFNFQP